MDIKKAWNSVYYSFHVLRPSHCPTKLNEQCRSPRRYIVPISNPNGKPLFFSIFIFKKDKKLKNYQISPVLDAILAIHNTPMNIYHCFAFDLVYRSCEVLRLRISKRYSKRHFLYVCQSHPFVRQTAPAWNQQWQIYELFLITQNLS